MAEEKDFLAICVIGVGSSFGRGPTTYEATTFCKKSLEQDWKGLFQLDGQIATINVFDVTGYDKLYWDHTGVHPEGEPDVTLERHHVATAKLSVPSQRQKKKKVKA